jgi:hypothetical protein
MTNCNCHTEINRDGSGQLSRYLKALDPSYAHIDDRSISDLLVFAKRYAAQIRFYDVPESDMGAKQDETKISWREFFRRDMAVVIASVGVIDAKQIKWDYDELRARLDQHPDHSIFAELFRPIIGMAARIDRWYSLAIPANPLHTDLDLAIASNLKEQVRKMIAYENGFLSVDPRHPLKLDLTPINDKILWGLTTNVPADTSIYEGNSTEDKIRYAALYVDDIFNSFYGFLVHLVDISDSYLHYAIEQYPAHQPHMALFIAFLRLFKEAQDQMNGLTEKMLNFYYRDVLHLAEKPSVPDKAYVVFELAKDVLTYDIAEGTALKAGKDSSGKEQIYKTKTDFVVNEAKVKELKTIFIDKTADAKPKIEAVYARPVAKSADGFGEKFTDPSGKWPTFGKGGPRLVDVKNICQAIDQYNELANRKDQAQVGFAIASPQLVLQAGNRLIKCRLEGFKKLLKNNTVSLLFTGEEGWMLINRDEPTTREIFDKGEFRKDLPSEKCFHFYEDDNTLYIFLPIAEKGIIAFDAEVHKEYSFTTSYPVMQIMLDTGINAGADVFNGLKCDSFGIEVNVGSMNPTRDINPDHFIDVDPRMDGLTTLNIFTDDGPVEAGKPFDPFTAFPQQGSSFSIGSDEIFNKSIDELTINIEPVTQTNNDGNQMVKFMRRANISHWVLGINVVAEGRRTDLVSDDDGNVEFTLDQMTQNVLFGHNKILLKDRLPILYNEELTNNTYKGFITIKNLLPVQDIDNNIEKARKNLFEIMQELAKLLKVRQISLSYHSSLDKLDPVTDQFFHVYPFGVVETYFGDEATELSLVKTRKPVNRVAPRKPSSLIGKPAFQELDKERDYLLVDGKRKLLPQFTYQSPYTKYKSNSVDIDNYRKLLKDAKIDWKDEIVPRMIEASGLKEKTEGDISQYSGNLQEEGMLFIGLEKLKPLQNISLLFQFAEGSAEDEDNDPPPIHWSYLTNNEWRPLKDENIISDGTQGFFTTGIINIEVPADASVHNTIITDGLIWFCASVSEYSNRIPMLVDVVAQATEAEFADNGNDQSHFDMALKAGSISKLSETVAEIAKVDQPFASFDGKHKEIGKEFYMRVSERLRHKGRAITAWDYEHLVLNRFPGIYKVKCVTHTDPNCFCRHPQEPITAKPKEEPCCGPQVAPGHVLIIPIADLKNRNAVDPLQPKTSRRIILEIQKYIAARTSPFVKVHVRNPLYEQVLVYFKVKFFPGIDKGFYLKKLNEEIVHYLTPWAFDANAEVKFGEKVYASSVINFIEERDYVDFITDFLMFVCRDECCAHPLASASLDRKEPLTATISFTVDPTDPDSIKGEIIDTTTGQPVTGASVVIKGTTKGAITNATGSFSLLPDTAEPVLVVSVAGYQPHQIKAEEGKSTDIEFVPTKEGVVVSHAAPGINPAKLNKGCGCSEVEYVLESSPSFVGETVAIPSTPRSILVSVPQHIIIPFEEPVRPSRCEERKKKLLAGVTPVVKTIAAPTGAGRSPKRRKRKHNG